MSRRCALTGKGVQVCHNVSHAQNKTKRRFLPNLRQQSFYSEILGVRVRLRVAASTIRTVERRGGIDGFLADASTGELPGDLRRLKKRIEARQAARQQAAQSTA